MPSTVLINVPLWNLGASVLGYSASKTYTGYLEEEPTVSFMSGKWTEETEQFSFLRKREISHLQ